MRKNISEPVWTPDEAYYFEGAKEILRQMEIIYISHLRLIKFLRDHECYSGYMDLKPLLKKEIKNIQKESNSFKWHEEEKIEKLLKKYCSKVTKYKNLIEQIEELLQGYS